MKCPKCETTLKMGERSGIEIDYCEQCRGIWLDAGEIDKIIERNQFRQQVPATPAPAPQQAPPPPQERRQKPYREKREESWWEKITDIFD